RRVPRAGASGRSSAVPPAPSRIALSRKTFFVGPGWCHRARNRGDRSEFPAGQSWSVSSPARPVGSLSALTGWNRREENQSPRDSTEPSGAGGRHRGRPSAPALRAIPMSKQWFDVDRVGLGRQAEEQGKGRLIGELVQNALDEEGVTRIDVTLALVPGRPL